LAQDDYYYEIQLTNKQLVFYFMAGATGLILSFLAGVMVGRGVDSVSGEVQAARTLQEDRIVAEETPKPAAKPATEDLTYAQRLEGEKVDDSLERTRPGAARPGKPGPAFAKVPPPAKAAAPGTAPANTASSGAAAKPAPKPDLHAGPAAPPTRMASNTAAPAPVAVPPPAVEAPSGFTLQVGVFKEKARADAMVARLKSKGYAPGVSGGADGPWIVRVGHYADRAAVERDQARLRDEEKLQPFIVKR
jgi:cell division protein FtsN